MRLRAALEGKMPLVSGGVLLSPGSGPPAAVPVDSFMGLGTVCPTTGRGFRGGLESSDLGREEGEGTRQWAWAPFINRKPLFSGLVASPSAANPSAPTGL